MRQGWNVIATMRRPEEETELAQLPGVLVVRLDVEDRASIDSAIASGLARFGRIDAVVNNAGFGLFGVFRDHPSGKDPGAVRRERFRRDGRHSRDPTAFPGRTRRASSSTSARAPAFFTLPMLSLYCASKFALEGFSESLAYELSSQNIIVKIIEPGGVIRHELRAAQRHGSGAERLPLRLRGFRRPDREGVRRLAGRPVRDRGRCGEGDLHGGHRRTNRLRYVATADIVPLVQARRETSEENYSSLMRARFTPPA